MLEAQIMNTSMTSNAENMINMSNADNMINMSNMGNASNKDNMGNASNMRIAIQGASAAIKMQRILLAGIICLCLLFPKAAKAQAFPNDVAAIEAYINDHKKQRSLLLMRSTLEESNGLLHKASQLTHRDYKEINFQLDKYTKAFDIIDLVYNTVSTGFNVYRTYETVTDKIGKYKAMLTDFNDKIVMRGRFETADTLLLTVNYRAIRNIADECKNLYSSVAVIAAYAIGKVQCTTSSMMLLVESINSSLDRIKMIVNSAYYQTWKFIRARTHYWKGELYRSKTIGQLASEALGRWGAASRTDAQP